MAFLEILIGRKMESIIEQVSSELWNDKSNQEEFMEYLKIQFKVQQLEDWYQVFIFIERISKHGIR